jgi:hypothetical protein
MRFIALKLLFGSDNFFQLPPSGVLPVTHALTGVLIPMIGTRASLSSRPVLRDTEQKKRRE